MSSTIAAPVSREKKEEGTKEAEPQGKNCATKGQVGVKKGSWRRISVGSAVHEVVVQGKKKKKKKKEGGRDGTAGQLRSLYLMNWS